MNKSGMIIVDFENEKEALRYFQISKWDILHQRIKAFF